MGSASPPSNKMRTPDLNQAALVYFVVDAQEDPMPETISFNAEPVSSNPL